MPSKDKDVFYLKLQWISAKDDGERKKLAEQIRQLLSQQRK
jgi:hypothetical protein